MARTTERVFGDIPGVPIGTVFDGRAELAQAGVHRPTMAGISGSGSEGADSIVLSGGYEDDEDYGDEIVYTGHGGNDPDTKRQVADQDLTRGNLSLAVSCREGLPVRVVRGADLDSPFAPAQGYRYDGLYIVEGYWHQQGRSGFRVWRYRLRRDDDRQPPWGPSPSAIPAGTARPTRHPVTTQRIVRSTATAGWVKQLHGHRCQICGLRLDTPSGPYAEAAHIRPLGSPHQGPDTPDNLLCLCPNDHVLFDLGAVTISDDFEVVGFGGRVRLAPGHEPSREHLRYHREHIGPAVTASTPHPEAGIAVEDEES
jgi:putative restriction endonuclease